MKDFVIRLTCLLVLVGIFVSYDVVLAMRDKDEQIAQLRAQVEDTQFSSGSTDAVGADASEEDGVYRDGTYTGSAQGYGGMVTMEVAIEKGKLQDIRVISASNEDASYWSMATQMIPKMIEQQTAEVDTVSGATFSSVGIFNAVADALNQAME